MASHHIPHPSDPDDHSDRDPERHERERHVEHEPEYGQADRAHGEPITGSTDSGPIGTGRPNGTPPERISLSSPNDVVATMPYLVGEPPVPGLVVLTLCGRSVRSVLCRDLGRTEAADPLACAGPPVDSAVTEGADAVIVVGYGTADQVSGHVGGLATSARRRGLKVLEAFRVHAGRYWSQLCVRPGCCPPEGSGLDADRSTGPAEAVLRGLTPRPPLRTVMDEIARARRTLDPPGSLRAETVRAALVGAEAEAERLLRAGERVLRRCGAAVLRSAVEAERTGAGPHGVEELVRLAVFLRARPVRDTVWATITPETARTHLDLWSRVTRASLPPDHGGRDHGADAAFVPAADRAAPVRHARTDRAAPAALVAVAAWQLEELVLARAALETSLEADPQYSMALLMQQALDVGLPAERWIDHLHDRSG
ncbi:DUF4192 domain-containing protein [Nocardiopsis salina]|uniref:DUF4192 domain-containing protein n=1 Tax=Nocardiopsis salina TaxID=245836 RepID=UPI00034D2512|nr:DUF4192 domain-containing protein [Nocardiopsis salina]